MYIHDVKEDTNVPCLLPARAAGIKRKRVQTDAGARISKKVIKINYYFFQCMYYFINIIYCNFNRKSMKNFTLRVQRINVMLRKTVMSLLNSRHPLPNTSSNNRATVRWAGGTLLYLRGEI